jgi:glycosyltransferase involved in cell wall biosynthesis
LLLVGPDNLPDDERRRRLHALPNVVFTGQKKVEELPAYLKVFDAALIPYVIGGHTLTVYPLKLHEYLAAGCPVVATALPELRAFTHVVRVAESYDQYIDYVREALADHSAKAVAARVAVAKQNTWDQRVTDIYAALGRHPAMAAKGGERVENQLHRLDAIQPSH